MQRDVFHFTTVEIPYEAARRFIRDDPVGLFVASLDGASQDKDDISGILDVDVEGIVLGADVTLEIGDFEEVIEPLPLSRRRIGWHAAEHTGIFPILMGELEVFPVGPARTQVTFTCHYRPPLKTFGAIVDTVYMHRIADECLERFFSRLVESLEKVGSRSVG